MKNLIKIFVIISMFIAIHACVDRDYDTPPEVIIPEGNVLTIGNLHQIIEDSISHTFVEDYSVYGVITADETSGNLYKSLFMESAEYGINLRLKFSASLIKVGDSIRIALNGLTVQSYNGTYQIGEIDPDMQIIKQEVGLDPEPEIVTISQLLSGAYNCRLVKLENVQFEENALGETYADVVNQYNVNHDLTDCNGNSVIVRTSGFASFAGETVAEGNGTFIGISSEYNGDVQLTIRNLNEIELNGERCTNGGGGGGGGPVDPVTSFSLDFEQFANYDDVVVAGWVNFAEAGSRIWHTKEYSGNVYGQMNAYNSTDASNISWLVTPPIDFDVNANEILEFQNAVAFYTHESFNLYISFDFDGENVLSANWTEITGFTKAGSSTDDYVWVDSGEIDLSSYSGIGHIAFKYNGDVDLGETGTFILDNIVLSNNVK